MDAIWAILAAVFSSVTAPVILTIISNHQRMAEKEKEWARADRLEELAKKADVQLTAIHTLTNSAMTIAIKGELVATKALLAALIRERALGASEDLEALEHDIEALEDKVNELQENLSVREAAQYKVDQQNIPRPPPLPEDGGPSA